MGILSVLEVRLRKQLGRLDLAQVPQPDLYDAINAAHTFLIDRFEHLGSKAWFKFQTAAGTANYALPTNYTSVLRVFDTVRRRALRKITKDFIPRVAELPTSRPRWYAREGVFITLYPTPNDVYVLGALAKIKVSPLLVPTDETLTDATWDDGLLRRARYEYYDATGDTTKAQIALASFTEWIATKPETEAEEQRDLDTGVSAPVLEGWAAERADLPGYRFIPANNWFNEQYPE